MSTKKTKSTLTIKQLLLIFGVSHMTISHWRKGTATKPALPTVAATSERSVLFYPKEVKAWAKANKVIMILDPITVAAGESTTPAAPAKPATPAVVKTKVAPAAAKVVATTKAEFAKRDRVKEKAQEVAPVSKAKPAVKKVVKPVAKKAAVVTPAKKSKVVALVPAAVQDKKEKEGGGKVRTPITAPNANVAK